jgi:hypothetical protein
VYRAALPPKFVSSSGQLDECLRAAKLHQCPHCKRSGTLIGHGFLRGYAEHGSERVIRGRRLFCSDRFLRPGCGRTVAILLDTIMRAFSVRSTTLFELAMAAVSGGSIRAAWQSAARSFSLSSAYRLWHRLLDAQSYLRTRLLSVCPPPPSLASDPLAQLYGHFRQALMPHGCPFAAFQSQLHSPLLPQRH